MCRVEEDGEAGGDEDEADGVFLFALSAVSLFKWLSRFFADSGSVVLCLCLPSRPHKHKSGHQHLSGRGAQQHKATTAAIAKVIARPSFRTGIIAHPTPR